MGTQAHRPRLITGIRKYGRYLDESFQPLNTSSLRHASIGSKSIGKVKIDCQLLFKSSRWGMLGRDEELPAGIIYVNLNFGPPQGCRVKSATVTITLDEEATCLERYQRGRVFHESGCPVQMTDLYGPKALAGQNKTASVDRTTKLTPEVNVLGNGGGGVGYESKNTFTHSARWTLNGQLLPGSGKKNRAIYKSLRWDLNENKLESQSFHSSTVSTAFTFEYSGQPFLLNVDIDGKLEKWDDRIKSKLKFGTTMEKEGRVVTLVDVEDYTRFTENLDPIAESLPRAMEMQNFQEIPVVVPDSIPGTVFQAAQSLPHAAQDPPQSTTLDNSTPLQSLTLPGRPVPLLTENPMLSQPAAISTDSDSVSSAQEFMRALRELEDPDTYRILPEDLPPSSGASSTTIVGTTGDGSGTEMSETLKPRALQRNSEVDEETLARVMDLPIIIMFLRLVSKLMSLIGKDGRLEEGPDDAADIWSVRH